MKSAKPRGIQSTIMFAISVISISIMLILGIVMYIRFSVLSRQEIIQSTQKLMEQAGENLKITWAVCGRFQTRSIITL